MSTTPDPEQRALAAAVTRVAVRALDGLASYGPLPRITWFAPDGKARGYAARDVWEIRLGTHLHGAALAETVTHEVAHLAQPLDWTEAQCEADAERFAKRWARPFLEAAREWLRRPPDRRPWLLFTGRPARGAGRPEDAVIVHGPDEPSLTTESPRAVGICVRPIATQRVHRR